MASWLETLGAFVGGGAALELIKLLAFRDRDAADLRNRQANEIDVLRFRAHHWRNVAEAFRLRCSELMSELNDLLESLGRPAKFTNDEIFAPIEPAGESKDD